MAIAYRSQSNTIYGTRTNTTLTAPSGIADGDILRAVVFVLKSGSTPAAPSAPSGWTKDLTGTEKITGSDHGVVHYFWKRASSESGSYTWTHASQDSDAVMSCYSGCIRAGSPFGTSSENTGTGSSLTGTGITTGSNNSWLLYEEHNYDFPIAGSPPTGMTEQFVSASNSGLYLATELRASAGATSDRTHTSANAAGSFWSVRMVELLAAQPPKSLYINQAVKRAAYW